MAETINTHPPMGIEAARLDHSIHHSFEEARELCDEWDDFVRSVSGDLFSTFDWCSVWWRCFGEGRRLEIHIFRQGKQTVAILPLFREVIRLGPLSVRAIRIVGCDHTATTCDLVILPGWTIPVVSQVLEVLTRLGNWDVIHWGPLPGYSQSVGALLEAMAHLPTVQVKCVQNHPHMIFDLPNTYEDYLRQLSLKERRNVRRDERRLERGGKAVRTCVTEEAELQSAFTRFLRMHQGYWEDRNKLGHFGDWPGVEAFHREMARRQFWRGRLTLLELRVNGQVVASEYGYRFGRRLHWILTARKADIPGRIGLCALVRTAVEVGTTQIDAMRGFYDYKRLLGARVAYQASIIAVRKGLLARMRAKAFREGTRLLDMLYYRIWFSHLAPRFPYLQRPLWPLWIRSRI